MSAAAHPLRAGLRNVEANVLRWLSGEELAGPELAPDRRSEATRATVAQQLAAAYATRRLLGDEAPEQLP